MLQDDTLQSVNSSDVFSRWTVVLYFFTGITPFFFVSTIYNETAILSIGFREKVQKSFWTFCDKFPSMTDTPARNSSMLCLRHRCSPQMYKLLRNLDKNRRFFPWNVVKESLRSSLDFSPLKRYSMNNFIKRPKCDDEDSRYAAKSKASRGRCEPGESRPIPKITSELQSEPQ